MFRQFLGPSTKPNTNKATSSVELHGFVAYHLVLNYCRVYENVFFFFLRRNTKIFCHFGNFFGYSIVYYLHVNI